MTDPQYLQSLYQQLIRFTQAWALGDLPDLERARALRQQIILLNHADYLQNIPVYKKFAEQEGIGALDDVEPLKAHLMFPDTLFKSYDQAWLDQKDFTRMNGWISEIHRRRVTLDVRDARSIDEWIARLESTDCKLVYSSGTSGNFSFVPRDGASWEMFRLMSVCCLAPLLLRRNLGSQLQRRLVKPAARLLSPNTFASLSRKFSSAGYDAVFLDFNRGRTGNQALTQELAPFFRRRSFLYESALSPSVLRLAARGAKTQEDAEQLRALQDIVVDQKERNYSRVIENIQRSTDEGQKVFIFGTTYQYKELCETIAASGKKLNLRDGSLVLFGGGWKLFTGAKIPRDQFMALMTDNLDLPPDRILEGYSMTEMMAFTLRCEHGRFHIPPYIEPVIFDEALEVMHGDDLRGTLGFLDPLARAYPGFIISGDEVHFVNGDCACGLNGAAVTEIGRARQHEVKGCGGIMASLVA